MKHDMLEWAWDSWVFICDYLRWRGYTDINGWWIAQNRAIESRVEVRCVPETKLKSSEENTQGSEELLLALSHITITSAYLVPGNRPHYRSIGRR